jgi:hypothetical protein
LSGWPDWLIPLILIKNYGTGLYVLLQPEWAADLVEGGTKTKSD